MEKDERLTLPGSATDAFLVQDLFISHGRKHYRIPVIAVDQADRPVVFANCRMDTAADGAREVGLVCRYMHAGTTHWAPVTALFARDGWDGAIGSATADSLSGKVILSYYRQGQDPAPGQQPSSDGVTGGAYQLVTADGGRSWKQDEFRVVPNGQGHIGSTHGSSPGIVLKNGRFRGRLLAPARFQTAPGESLPTLQYHHFNCALYSDDRGKTWQTSGPVQVGTGEGCLVELSDGRIYYNSRAYFLDGRRRMAWSYDGGQTFTDFGIDGELTEPMNGGCNAGMAVYPPQLSAGREIILFSNPAGEKRERMTVRASFDGGSSWPIARVIHEGPSAYSSLAVGADGNIYVLFENGEKHPYEKVTLARFSLDWLAAAP